MALSKEAIQSRKAFRTQYSKTTEEIVKMIAKNKDSNTIAEKVGVSVGTVVTTKGNFTREAYWPYAHYDKNGNVVGVCQY